MNELQVNQVLASRYRLEAKVGEGGMAVVYRAYDLQRRVQLAIKLLKPDYAEDTLFLQKFQREARSLQRLQHPNIVRFYELVEDGPRAFMVLDFIDGPTLRAVQRLMGRPLSPGEVLGYLRPVCAALSYAHSQRVVHCDMKPANVMVDRSGRVEVNDFGIARLSESATVTFSTPGTPAYMAPEQWRGGDDVTAATDVYALGVMLCELLTGRQPYLGETAPTSGHKREKVMWEHLNATAPLPSRLNPQVPGALDAVVLCCLEKDPARRYQTAEALLADYEAACRSVGIAEVPVPIPAPPAGGERPTLPPIDPPKPPVNWLAWLVARPGTSAAGAGVLVLSGGALIAVLAIGLLAFRGHGPAATPTTVQVVVSVIVTATPNGSTQPTEVTPGQQPSATESGTLLATSTLAPPPTTEPSLTPEPSLTLAASATPVPPTLPRPTPTPTRVVVACSYTGAFASIWSQLRDQLGCPVGNEVINGSGAVQEFTGGQMDWVGAKLTIYAFGSNGRWAGQPDTWVQGNDEISCPADQSGGVVRGFGKAWCNNAAIPNLMGHSTGGESPAAVSLAIFQKGFIFRSGGITRVAYYNTGVWQSR